MVGIDQNVARIRCPNISGDLLDIKGKTWWGLIRMLLEFDVPNISGDLLDIKGKHGGD